MQMLPKYRRREGSRGASGAVRKQVLRAPLLPGCIPGAVGP